MATVFQKGTRVIFGAVGTATASISAMTASAAIPSGYTQLANILSVDDLKPQISQSFDDASLEDTSPQINIELKPGEATITKKKNSQSGTLFGYAAAGTKIAFGVIYPDGSCHYSPSAQIIISSAVKAQAKDFQNKIPESIQILADAYFTFQEHA